jgi:hypothetical protein
MFFCSGCQNVQAVEPVHRGPSASVSATVASTSASGADVPPNLAGDSGSGLVAPPVSTTAEKDVVVEEHAPLPASRASTPDSSASASASPEADAQAGAEAQVEGEAGTEDTRMPVNRVVSSFDESIYSQQFTLHKVPFYDITIRAYEGVSDTYVTFDTTEPVTLPITTLRKVLNTIKPDPEKKYLGDNLMLAMGFFIASVLLRARDCS